MAHLGRRHVLVAYGADVRVPLELLGGGLRQAVDLAHRRAPLDERVPPGLGLAPGPRGEEEKSFEALHVYCEFISERGK